MTLKAVLTLSVIVVAAACVMRMCLCGGYVTQIVCRGKRPIQKFVFSFQSGMGIQTQDVGCVWQGLSLDEPGRSLFFS